MASFSVDAMRAADVAAVYDLQCAAHNLQYHEPALSFSLRLSRFPAGCLVARDTSGGIWGYTIAYPYPRDAALCTPPGLASDADDDSVSEAYAAQIAAASADPASAIWWIHDVAVRTSGTGIGGALYRAVLARGRELGFSAAACIAVSEAGRALNAKHGFAVLRELPAGSYALVTSSSSATTQPGARDGPAATRIPDAHLMLLEFKAGSSP